MKRLHIYIFVLVCAATTLSFVFIDFLFRENSWLHSGKLFIFIFDIINLITGAFGLICATKAINTIVSENVARKHSPPLVNKEETYEEIKAKLNNSLKNEDYESAAKLRDKLHKLNPNRKPKK